MLSGTPATIAAIVVVVLVILVIWTVKRLSRPNPEKIREEEERKKTQEHKIRQALDQGKMDEKDENGRSALFHAIHEEFPELAIKLIQQGAKRDARDKAGVCPIHYAARQGLDAVVESLLKSGVDVNDRAADNYTPVWIAADAGRTATVSLLIEYGADINVAVDKVGFTPIMAAALKGHIEVVNTLLMSNPNLLLKDQNGKQVDQLARENLGRLMGAYVKENQGLTAMVIKLKQAVARQNKNNGP